ncbi:MAG: amino acid permease [Blastocatellia bacterium]
MTTSGKQTRVLIRGLGLIAGISIIIGNVIGTGVFLKARVMTCNLGEPVWVLAAWAAAGMLTLAGALTYAELTAMKPEAGGEYVFLRDSYGRLSSFLFGWMQMLIAKPGSQASVAVIFSGALNDFLGGGLRHTILTLPAFGAVIEITSLQIIAVMMIVIFTTLNCASVSLSGQIATFLTGVKVGLIIFVGLGAFVFVSGGDFSHFSMNAAGATCEGVDNGVRYGTAGYSFAAGFGAAMLGALWGYDGWNNLSFVAGEVKNPGRNVPIAIIGSTLLVIALYLAIHVSYFYILDPASVASVSKDSSVARVVVSNFAAIGGAAAVAIFTVGLMISSLGTLHTSIVSGSRIPFAMARNGLMLPRLGALSVTGVPVPALISQGILASILALSGSFDTLTDYVIFASWIFYALVASSIFVYRKRYPELDRPYRVWGYPVVPVLFLLVAVALLVQTLINSPRNSLVGIGIILAGLPFYFYLNSRNSHREGGNAQ